MTDRQQRNEVNIAGYIPWVALLGLIILLIYLWPNDDKAARPAETNVESSATVSQNQTGEKAKTEKAEALDLLRFRAEPSTDNSVVIGTVRKGEVLKVLEKQDEWLKVQRDDGTSGYITTDPKFVKLKSE